MGCRSTVGQRALTPRIKVRILAPQPSRPLGGTVDADDLKSSIREDIPVRIRKEPPLRENGVMAATADSKSAA